MSKKSFLGAERLDAAELLPVPAPPTTTEAREDGMAVSTMAQERVPAFMRETSAPSAALTGRKAGRRVPWSALSFGVLLLASLSACLERLSWMGGR